MARHAWTHVRTHACTHVCITLAGVEHTPGGTAGTARSACPAPGWASPACVYTCAGAVSVCAHACTQPPLHHPHPARDQRPAEALQHQQLAPGAAPPRCGPMGLRRLNTHPSRPPREERAARAQDTHIGGGCMGCVESFWVAVWVAVWVVPCLLMAPGPAVSEKLDKSRLQHRAPRSRPFLCYQRQVRGASAAHNRPGGITTGGWRRWWARCRAGTRERRWRRTPRGARWWWWRPCQPWGRWRLLRSRGRSQVRRCSPRPSHLRPRPPAALQRTRHPQSAARCVGGGGGELRKRVFYPVPRPPCLITQGAQLGWMEGATRAAVEWGDVGSIAREHLLSEWTRAPHPCRACWHNPPANMVRRHGVISGLISS